MLDAQVDEEAFLWAVNIVKDYSLLIFDVGKKGPFKDVARAFIEFLRILKSTLLYVFFIPLIDQEFFIVSCN